MAALKGDYQVYYVSNEPNESKITVEHDGYHCVGIQRGISIVKDFKALIALTKYFRKERFDAVHSVTPKAGLLTGPLRDRFGVICRLELYSTSELATIIKRSAKLLNISIDDVSACEIASRSRGTPRIANRFLKRVRDFADVYSNGQIDINVTRHALSKLQVDELGLDFVDMRILRTIIEKFKGGPVGLDTLSASTGEEPGTIEDVYEPYLLQLGFISRTPRGRIALKPAYDHLGIPYED